MDNEILWLPDVFGYSAALPQILQKCGIPYFMTTKISWNEFNKMPYDTFEWEGIDGSRVLTHFVPTRDYNKAAVEGGTETEHFTTYNGYINPSQMKGAWARYSQKYLNEEVLCSFGFGDGGGGPTKDMLENQRRLAKGLPGMPRTKMSTAKEFFHVLDKHVTDKKYLPTWVGELYLEYHRGTYTSMARNKKFNRKAEFAYQNEEMYAMLDAQTAGGAYPEKELHEGWEVILRNQFHDILPGSSIKEVYDDSKAEYEGIFAENKALTDATLAHIAAGVKAPKHSLVVYNPNSAAAYDLVTFTVPEGMEEPAVYDGETKLAVQKTADVSYVFFAAGVPGKGYKTYIVKEGILTSYLHDRISAKHYGIPSTGNGRRESFRQMPFPRMRATYMEAGNMTEEEMISTVKKGIYASSFTNGQVQIGAGDFTFFVKDGYLIENGKLTQPIKDINIIGNGPRALADITMVGNNYKMDNGTWTCGKDGQSCPVTCGMPSALVSKLTVGGEN